MLDNSENTTEFQSSKDSYLWKQIKRFQRRILSSKVCRASFFVIACCGIAVWISKDTPATLKDLVTLLFHNAEPIAISSASAVFLLESHDRRKAAQYEAWQVINSALGQTGSGGRIQALEDLNSDGADLEGVAVPKADLSKVSLKYGKLERANFEGTELDGANLRGANLRGANLRGANLRGANLSICSLPYADLRGAHLHKTNLRGANLSQPYLDSPGAKTVALGSDKPVDPFLSGANLSGTFLYYTDLRRAHLNRVRLNNAKLIFSDLDGASMKRADLSYADLRSARGLTRKQVDEALLCETKLPEDIRLNPNRDCIRLNLLNSVTLSEANNR